MKLKQWRNIFYVIVDANSIVQHLIQIKNGITKGVNVNVKIIISVKMIIVRILDISDISVIACDEIIFVMDTVSTKITNTIATNVTQNYHSKNVRISTFCIQLC